MEVVVVFEVLVLFVVRVLNRFVSLVFGEEWSLFMSRALAVVGTGVGGGGSLGW